MENLRRSYEISVWTLQDSFITVLKPSNLEFKGQIVDPLMNIKDDGENKLSLKIPMYIRSDSGEMVENPLWCNTRNGTIIVDLRKLKVIFNKATTSEEVFEFLITNMKEEHEGLKKYCEVECEGLAFHELGKQGYKIALEGGDEIEIEQKKYFDGESKYTVCPQPTINYWADRVFKNSNWHYSIQMDWSAHDGITHQIYEELNLDSDNYASFSVEQRNNFNSWRAENGLRRRDRVYEDSFVSAWGYNEGKLTPKTITEEREKYRLVEASESNRYNLSQTIAEIFQVYCKYKYYYDDNYHIIDREVIFYNNFLNESQGVIDLTYKYNTEHLTRIMDATDTVSKMYVRPLNDGDAPGGEALISDTDANKSKEDYLLNFDYLYNIGTITQEQYDEIEPYYAKLHEKNEQYHLNSEKLAAKEKEKTKQEARKTTAEQAMEKDNENISNNDAIARNLEDGEGNIHVTVDNAQMLYLIPEGGDKKTYYCNFKSQGIVRDSIKLYWDKPLNKDTEITQYNIENDEFGEVSKVVNINKGKDANSYIYATFNYSPNTYFKKVSEIYGIRLGQDQAFFNDASKQVTNLEEDIAKLTDEQNTLLEEKAKIISDFENMMGPALREGTWQPEDEYSNYGEVYEKEIELKNNGESSDGLLSLGWDNELFDDEQDFHYQYGATLQDRYYPCIEITPVLLNALTSGNYDITKFLAQLTLIYKNSETGTAQRIKQYIAINSKMKIAFLRNKTSKVVTPVLMITDAATMDNEQLALLQSTSYLAYISSNTATGVISETVTYTNLNWLIKPTEITNNKNYEIVYPRFKIDSLFVKSPYTMITVKRQEGTKWELLANYENFYILPRTSYYTVTIKPEAIFLSTNPLNFPLNYKIYFTISMSPLAIYLDAVQVLKENSFPKVSYEIDVMSVNEEFVYSDYSRLGQIAHINDYEFRFENTLGYISELDLDLDKPWQDKAIIKNYKTKFEDIFSTIVAQTEQMKKNSATIAMAASAFNSDGTLSSSILGESLMSEILSRAADNTTDGSVPSPATEFMKYDPLIRNELRQTYNEAGKVLAAASKSVEDVIALDLRNADILRSFQVDIADNVAPSLFRIGKFKKEDGTEVEYAKRHKIVNGIATENAEFKMGDFLEKGERNEEGEKVIYTISVYTAVQSSSKIQYDLTSNPPEEPGISMKGWTPLKDGKLAVSDITGASINMDAEAGRMEILAGKQMNLLCGGNLNLLGGESVVIGGPDVTIFSGEYIEKEDGSIETPDLTKGVHIFATRYNPKNSSGDKAAVDITGNGIEMRASQGINFISSNVDGEDIAVISLSKDKGIYLGSNQPIRLFSGTSVPSSGITNASVEISNSRILFGVTNGQKGNAVDITKDYIIFGSSFINSNGEETTTNIGSSTGGAGVKITQTSIQMATGTANTNTRNYISMDSSGIIIANANNETNGSYVKVSKDGVLIGANTTTQQQNLINDITGTSHNISYSGARFQVYAPNFCVNSSGTLYAYNANISGTIRATGGEICPADADKIYIGRSNHHWNGSKYIYDSAIYSGSKSSLTANSSGFYLGTNGLAIGAYNSNTKRSPFEVDTSGNLYAKGAIIEGNIIATDGSIGGWTIDKDSDGHGYLYYSSATPGGSDSSLLLFPYGYKTTNSIAGSEKGEQHFWSFTIGKKFGVTDQGELFASAANISGTITSKNGSIGGWTIDDDSIFTGIKDNSDSILLSSKPFSRTINGESLSNLRFAMNNKFGVTSEGKLYASDANISGIINSEEGKIGGWYIGSSYIGNEDSLENSTIGLYNGNKTQSEQDGMEIEIDESELIIDVDLHTDDDGNISLENNNIVNNSTKNNYYIALWAGSSKKIESNFQVYTDGTVKTGNLYTKNAIINNTLITKEKISLYLNSDTWQIKAGRSKNSNTTFNIVFNSKSTFNFRYGSDTRLISSYNKLILGFNNNHKIEFSSNKTSISGDTDISGDLQVTGNIYKGNTEILSYIQSNIRQFPSNGLSGTIHNLMFRYNKNSNSWHYGDFTFKDGLLINAPSDWKDK